MLLFIVVDVVVVFVSVVVFAVIEFYVCFVLILWCVVGVGVDVVVAVVIVFAFVFGNCTQASLKYKRKFYQFIHNLGPTASDVSLDMLSYISYIGICLISECLKEYYQIMVIFKGDVEKLCFIA